VKILLQKNAISYHIGPKSKTIELWEAWRHEDAVKAFNIPMVPGCDQAITEISKNKVITIEFEFLLKLL
jgi:hypothetical protein